MCARANEIDASVSPTGSLRQSPKRREEAGSGNTTNVHLWPLDRRSGRASQHSGWRPTLERAPETCHVTPATCAIQFPCHRTLGTAPRLWGTDSHWFAIKRCARARAKASRGATEMGVSNPNPNIQINVSVILRDTIKLIRWGHKLTWEA